MKESIAIIIPAYNASYTLPSLIRIILDKFEKVIIYIIEDSSPDGTGKIISKKFANNKRVRLYIRKQKMGRGSAVLLGINEALKNKNINKIVEMDADLYHDPKFLPKLLKASEKSDVVIASRYINNSQILGSTFKRRVFSRIANLWARVVLGLTINDLTNGYRVYNRNAAEIISKYKFRSSGFAILTEILVCLSKNEVSIAEIPTTVTYDKKYGSNFSLKEIKEAFLTSIVLRISN